MVMIATMINCVMIIMPAPLATAHDHLSPAFGAAVDPGDSLAASARRDAASAAMLRASSRGSGRSSSHSTRAPEVYATAASKNGPDRAGRPSLVANVPVILTR